MQRHLLVAAVLATLSLLVSGQTDYPDFFYKLSLQWPPSVCAPSQCPSRIPRTFTIHGLWPQSVEDDKPIPPNNKKKCTDVIPTAPDQILDALQPIPGKLNDLWPSLLKQKTNEEFWRHEWEKHGMCSDYPDKPRDYFTIALDLTTRYNPLEVMEIQPGDEPRKVEKILESVKRNVGAYPQIQCNGGDKKGLQLKEIRFCFVRAKPPSVFRDCPNKLAGECKQLTDRIRLPPLPPEATHNDEL
ncbi:PREDICTED: ribonuclease MC [Theobroma cacao]|uniref:Ribonuclease MC n=1 Tax=Theobroma cacao TaxID=3641 RepID=A0AB32X2X4_THECC|nr:PREDICTED: ribonuclease MC [Theobroma cacao]